MKKSDRIVLFNGITGFMVSIILYMVVRYILTVSYNYEMLIPIVLFECAFYITLTLDMLLDIFFSKVSIGKKVKLFLLIVLVSPLLWSAIEAAYNHETWFPDFFAKYSPFSITLSYLISELFVKTSTVQPASSSRFVLCTKCNINYSAFNAFCPKCNTISPKVLETPIKHPEMHYLDFTDSPENFTYTRCPYCKHLRRGSDSIYPSELGTPFQVCGNCNEFYTNRSSFEWSVISPIRKLQYCLYGGNWLGTLLVATLVFFYIYTYSHRLSFLFLASVCLFRLIWLRFITIFDIRDSKARLDANPEYPQLLVKMGYEILDKKYEHLYKQKK